MVYIKLSSGAISQWEEVPGADIPAIARQHLGEPEALAFHHPGPSMVDALLALHPTGSTSIDADTAELVWKDGEGVEVGRVALEAI